MVYGRKRSSNRRKGRRGNRVLSTRRIFNSKGAKAQAAQIYALRKSVNSVRRQCRPEIKERGEDISFVLGQSTIGVQDMNSFNTRVIQYPYEGSDDKSRIGNLIKILPMKYRLTMQYREDSTGGVFSQLPSRGLQVRIFAIQLKTASINIPTLSELMEGYQSSEDNLETLSNMSRQFKRGITAKYNILFNRVYSLSQDKPVLSRSLSIRPQIRSVRWEENVNYPRGQIIVYILQGGATNKTVSETSVDYNAVDVKGSFTLPYTDV